MREQQARAKATSPVVLRYNSINADFKNIYQYETLQIPQLIDITNNHVVYYFYCYYAIEGE